MEIGAVFPPVIGGTTRVARILEDVGFDVLLCSDTQNVAPDPYATLALAAEGTSRITLGPGVTNLVTRHPAVTASAVMTLQVLSGGRAICGIGRGDSSLAHVGLRAPTTAQLRDGLLQLRGYLRGEAVGVVGDGLESRLRWVDPLKVPAVPLDLAATGPRTLRLAADVADRISLSLGAHPDLIRAAVDIIEARLAETGRPRRDVRIGAYLPVVVHDDADVAVQLARAGTALLAHFPATPGASDRHLPERWQEVTRRLAHGYDMARHSRSDGSHMALVDDEFIRWFAITGPPSACTERLLELREMGIEHVYTLGAMGTGPRPAVPPEWLESHRRLGEQVVPALR
jgi:5,10-methylenetetrahydromethanopterin reductase